MIHIQQGVQRVVSGTKKFLRLLPFALLFGAIGANAWADLNPADDSANIQITIVPNIDRGVIIDTDTPNMLDLGDVQMGMSTQTVYPATVTILGTVTNTELELSANITGGWKFDDDVTTMEQDDLAVWCVFKATTSAVPPAKTGSNFDDAMDALSPASPSAFFGPLRVGLAGGNGGLNDRFEDGSVDMDSLAPGTKRHMWFYLRMPNQTSTANTQKITFILSVTPGP